MKEKETSYYAIAKDSINKIYLIAQEAPTKYGEPIKQLIANLPSVILNDDVKGETIKDEKSKS